MTSDSADPLASALDIAAHLDTLGISYAIGGALAYGFVATPRSTADVDLNVFLSETEVDLVIESLRSAGAEIVPEAARAAVAATGAFVARLGPWRLDVFLSSVPYCSVAERTRIRRRIGEREAWFLSAEAIAVFKLMFFRGKDLVDLQRLAALRRRDLDFAGVRAAVVEMVGEDDERVRAWDRIRAAASTAG